MAPFLAFMIVLSSECDAQVGSAIIVERLLQHAKMVPDCKFNYSRLVGVYSEDAEPSLQDKPGDGRNPPGFLRKTENAEFCKFGSSFYLKILEKSVLQRQVSFDGSNYYYLEAGHKQKKLWIGTANGVVSSMLSMLLLNNPIYAQFQPLVLPNTTHFYYPHIETRQFWTEASNGCHFISVDAHQVKLEKTVPGVVYSITYNLTTLMPHLIAKAGDYIMGEMRITKTFEPTLPNGRKSGFLMPSVFSEGRLDEKGLPVDDCVVTTLAEDSFRLLTSPPTEGFAISWTFADSLMDPDLRMHLNK
jgi:hypothetical protein